MAKKDEKRRLRLPHRRGGIESHSIRRIVPQVAQRFRKPTLQEQTEEALQNIPRITNETVAEQREEVLKGARKYKYPLEHSKHKIVIVSASLLGFAVVGFFGYVILSLYHFQSTSLFMYRVTQVVPFPVARADGRWVSYESYLFELRHYIHYYEAQEQVNFQSSSGQYQLTTYRPVALQQVIDDAYVKVLATEHNISVSDEDVDNAVATLRVQARLGSNNAELESVTQKFFGWSLQDLRRQLKQELLAQKVAATLDTSALAKTQGILSQLQHGADFASLANQYSDDATTKGNGGQYNDTAITVQSQEVPQAIVNALSNMKPGQISNIITTQTSFEVVKLISVTDGKYKADHIQIKFQAIQSYLQPLEKAHSPRRFIHVKNPS